MRRGNLSMVNRTDRSRTYEDNVVHAELSFWGYHKGKQHAAEGYAPANTLAQLLSGRTDNPGHRILCLDMPARAGLINSVVMRLPTDYVAVLTARYCLPVEPSTGRPYEVSFLSELLGISTSVYRFRLHRAKVAYRQKIFSPTIASGG